jgi:hypothetical protein
MIIISLRVCQMGCKSSFRQSRWFRSNYICPFLIHAYACQWDCYHKSHKNLNRNKYIYHQLQNAHVCHVDCLSNFLSSRKIHKTYIYSFSLNLLGHLVVDLSLF